MAINIYIRVYDLARELRQDTKLIIEELRREGADVDVPSNQVEQQVADRIRDRYAWQESSKLQKESFKHRKVIRISKNDVLRTKQMVVKSDKTILRENENKDLMYKECTYCRKRLEKKIIEKHENECSENPTLVRFNGSPVDNTKTTPKKRCRICEKNLPMFASDYCYGCKDK